MDTLKKVRSGAIPDHYFKQFFSQGFILGADEANINPSSLDLRIDPATIVELKHKFLPSRKGLTIAQSLKHLGAQAIQKNNGRYYIKRGGIYAARIIESVQLPNGFFGRINPKSSTGRTDIHAQLMADYIPQFDRIPNGWRGELWVLFKSSSFNIGFPDKPVSLLQLRVFKNSYAGLSTQELQNLCESQVILRNDSKKRDIKFGDAVSDDRIEMSLDLRDWGEGGLGYIAKQGVISALIWEKGENDQNDFFEPIPKVVDNSAYLLEKDRFYILSTRESIYIPREYACEMISFDDTRGELRTHYAGFIDNGWGENGPRPLTLEVRPYESTTVYHGQPITSVMLHYMYAPILRSYDEMTTSNYKMQDTAKLGKFFK